MKRHKVIETRNLTESTFILRVERNGLEFQTGQFVILNVGKGADQREYSVYSGEKDEFIEVLVREVDGGKVSGKLKKLKAGDEIGVDGAFGFFRFNPESYPSKKFLLVATGTGISPFHSFVRTYPDLEYKLVHGVRYGYEGYDHNHFKKNSVTLCTSGDDNGDFSGRVTDFMAGRKVDPDTNCFLCGGSEMIYEMFDILTGKGIPVSNIYSEVYF